MDITSSIITLLNFSHTVNCDECQSGCVYLGMNANSIYVLLTIEADTTYNPLNCLAISEQFTERCISSAFLFTSKTNQDIEILISYYKLTFSNNLHLIHIPIRTICSEH